MRVFYLTSSVYADNQLSLLHHFPRDKYELIYGVIFPNKNSNYSEPEISAYCKAHAINYIPFPLRYRFRDLRNLLHFDKIVKTVNASRADVVFVTNFDQLYLNLMLLRLDKRKTIIGMHDVENHSNTAFGGLATLAKTILLKNFKYFLTYSKHQAELLNANYKEKNVYSISLPLIGFGPLSPRQKVREATTFLFFGNILHYKGLDILLRSMSRLSDKYKNFKLIIAGRCNDWAETYAPLISEPDKTECHIGFIENKDIPNYFADVDYLVLPYRDTTQSGPLMIAYNYNVPVIASNASGFKEFFVEGETGYSFNLQDDSDIDRVLGEAISRTNEEYVQLKQRMAKHAKAKYSVETLANAYSTMFETVAVSN